MPCWYEWLAAVEARLMLLVDRLPPCRPIRNCLAKPAENEHCEGRECVCAPFTHCTISTTLECLLACNDGWWWWWWCAGGGGGDPFTIAPYLSCSLLQLQCVEDPCNAYNMQTPRMSFDVPAMWRWCRSLVHELCYSGWRLGSESHVLQRNYCAYCSRFGTRWVGLGWAIATEEKASLALNGCGGLRRVALVLWEPMWRIPHWCWSVFCFFVFLPRLFLNAKAHVIPHGLWTKILHAFQRGSIFFFFFFLLAQDLKRTFLAGRNIFLTFSPRDRSSVAANWQREGTLSSELRRCVWLGAQKIHLYRPAQFVWDGVVRVQQLRQCAGPYKHKGEMVIRTNLSKMSLTFIQIRWLHERSSRMNSWQRLSRRRYLNLWLHLLRLMRSEASMRHVSPFACTAWLTARPLFRCVEIRFVACKHSVCCWRLSNGVQSLVYHVKHWKWYFCTKDLYTNLPVRSGRVTLGIPVWALCVCVRAAGYWVSVCWVRGRSDTEWHFCISQNYASRRRMQHWWLLPSFLITLLKAPASCRAIVGKLADESGKKVVAASDTWKTRWILCGWQQFWSYNQLHEESFSFKSCVRTDRGTELRSMLYFRDFVQMRIEETAIEVGVKHTSEVYLKHIQPLNVHLMHVTPS